jgi:hypothetical protein
MSAIWFGIYHQVESTTKAWQSGERVRLDCCDGFDDQSLDGEPEGSELTFILDSPEMRHGLWNSPATEGEDVAREIREVYLSLPLLTVRTIEPGGMPGTMCVVVSSQVIQDVYRNKKSEGISEAKEVIKHMDSVWEAVARGLAAGVIPEDETPESFFVYTNHLPTLSQIEQCRTEGFCGWIVHSNVYSSRCDMTVLENQPENHLIRVTSLGGNVPRSSVIYDIVDTDRYGECLRVCKRDSRTEMEMKYWNNLLKE